MREPEIPLLDGRRFFNDCMIVSRFIFLFGVISFCALQLCAQDDSDGLIFFDALSFAGGPDVSSSRIDFYVAVPYSALDFTHGGDGFTARYRVRLILNRSDKGGVYDTSWTRSIQTLEYDRTTGAIPAFEFFQQRVAVEPGEYSASLEVLDYGTNLTSSAKRTISVIDFPVYEFSLSGLMLVNKIRENESGHMISPLLTSNVSLVKDWYFVFFEAYNYTLTDTFDLTALYRSRDGEIVWSETWEKPISRGKSQQWLRLPVEGFGRGNYLVEIFATHRGAPGDTLAAAKRAISFQGTAERMPLSKAELNDKIKKLRYVANQREIDYIEDGGTFAEEKRRYAEFWNERDPSPGTPKNEAMLEYFRRIDHANKNFRSYVEGWLTDMGRVYIVYGPPDRIDRDPFATDGRPRETWEYYARRLSLLFVDQTGFGDFRLQTPVPLSEKYRY